MCWGLNPCKPNARRRSTSQKPAPPGGQATVFLDAVRSEVAGEADVVLVRRVARAGWAMVAAVSSSCAARGTTFPDPRVRTRAGRCAQTFVVELHCVSAAVAPASAARAVLSLLTSHAHARRRVRALELIQRASAAQRAVLTIQIRGGSWGGQGTFVHHAAVSAPTSGNPVHQTNVFQLSVDFP